MTARFSRLPVLQYCGQAQRLGELGAGSRASAIGSAFHAFCADPESPETLALLARLTPEERSSVAELIRPTPITVNGVELTYEFAVKESPCILVDGEELIVQGTCDLYWVHEGVLYCADIKRSSFTVPDGPASLQVIGYALAKAEELGCHAYVPGIWDATQGEWLWGEYVDAWSDTAAEHRALVVAAARNDGGEYNVGPHCSQCYARTQCPQFLMPLELVETSLAPFTVPGGLTHENAAEALLMAKRAEDTADAVRNAIKQFARDNGGVRHEATGKVWKVSMQKGRVGLDRAGLERDNPGLTQRYMSSGAPYEVFKWVNIEGAKKTKKKGDGA